jgi:ADP-heptose:LPS heptosyltransferase
VPAAAGRGVIRALRAGRYSRGVLVLVFGSPAEAALTAEVAAAAYDLGGRTDLSLLAAGLAACELLVTNDSGPMHHAAVVGTATLSLQGPADPAETRPLDRGRLLLQGGELPCVPCVRNVCPRSGAGYLLPDAEQECLRSIGVDETESAVLSLLRTAVS